MRRSEKQDRNGERKGSETKIVRDNLDDEVDALFRLPLAEFTVARNALAAQLKKSGRGDEAVLVKALAKPPVSAWAVNQLYWNHREAFGRLIASADRFHKAQGSPGGGKIADMRTALDARREALADLTDLATSLLRDAGANPGQNPSLDIIRRITSTLEAMSAMSDWASRTDTPRPGRLTHDVDPPGFESLASWMPGPDVTQPTEERREAGRRRQKAGTTVLEIPKTIRFTQKSVGASTNTRRKAAMISGDDDVRQVEETFKAQVAEAKVSLQDAKRSLTEARARTQRLEAAQKKADAEAKKAEKHRRDAEESLEKAKAASEVAAQRARSVAVEVEEAASAVDAAERTVEKASNELEALSRE
jgi:hypothetical protein